MRPFDQYHAPRLPRFERSEPVTSEAYYRDKVTKLLWKEAYTAATSWLGALSACENANWAGRTDWRLPNLHELMSVLDFSRSAAPYGEIPMTPNSAAWTSTTAASSTSEAYIVDFKWASLGKLTKTDQAQAAWCVSGPLP